MGNLKLSCANLQRLNNAEFSFFTSQFVARVQADGLEALKIPQTIFDAYKANATLLSDLVAKSRIAHETAQIAEVRSEVKNVLVDLLATIRMAKSSALAARKEAGTYLYNETKPYVGAYRLALRELIEKIKGLLVDLAKDAAVPHVATLGLNDHVAQLSSLNAKLSILMDARTASLAANATDPASKIRSEMYDQLESMLLVVLGANIQETTEVLAGFIAYVEQLIQEVNTEYKQRRAQTSSKTDETETTPEASDTETPAEDTAERE